MQNVNYSNYKLSYRQYGGSEKKIGVTKNNVNYILKFQENSPFGFKYNHISEYLGSHIFNLLGVKSHETELGTYQGNNVVSCVDFLQDNSTFVPFNDVGQSTLDIDMDKFQYTYEDIIAMLESNKKLTNVKETTEVFFDIFIIDALIGNFDRHGANWGFIKSNGKYILAPVFDNGSSLFPSLTDDESLIKIMNDNSEIDSRIYKFPTSQILLNGKKSSYFDVISSHKFSFVNEALKRIYPRISLEKINELIDSISSISETRKSFYKLIIKERYMKILRYSYLGLGK